MWAPPDTHYLEGCGSLEGSFVSSLSGVHVHQGLGVEQCFQKGVHKVDTSICQPTHPPSRSMPCTAPKVAAAVDTHCHGTWRLVVRT